MAAEIASAMAGAASAHQAASASREETSQQRAGRRRRTSADPQLAQQGATAAAADAPAALDSLSRLQQLADASPQVAQLRRLQALADGRFAPVAQLAGGPEEEELVQGKFATAQLQPQLQLQLQLQQAPRVNNTGLPDQLKSGIESLSGLSMDHVRVHYNSSQPAQLNALAYAQGSDIHLAPGQERHLPHEAWHVVQQAQGRVKATMQIKEGVEVNDEKGLEGEAEVMGSKSLEGGHGVAEAYRSISMPIETAQAIQGDATNSLEMNVDNNHSAPLINGKGSDQRGGNEGQGIVDERPEAALQRYGLSAAQAPVHQRTESMVQQDMQTLCNASQPVRHLQALQQGAYNSPRARQLAQYQVMADTRRIEVNTRSTSLGSTVVQRLAINADQVPGLAVDLDTADLAGFKEKLTQLKRERQRRVIQLVGNYIRDKVTTKNDEDAYKFSVQTLFAARSLDEELDELATPTSSLYMSYLSLRYSGKTNLENEDHQNAIDDWVCGSWSLINNHLHGAMTPESKRVAEEMTYNKRMVGDLGKRAEQVSTVLAGLPAFEANVFRFAKPKDKTVYSTKIHPGDYIMDNGFTATSFVKSPEKWGTPGKVYYKITGGHAGKAIYPHSSIQSEWEVLIDKGSAFRVEAIKQIAGTGDESPTFYVIMTQVVPSSIPYGKVPKDYYSGDDV
jgi:hypothetical protein